ncbi:MAG: PAS domain S-box protein [Marinobacter sp.]|nr:PAS domain S-box protein [Marinobacter sp.]
MADIHRYPNTESHARLRQSARALIEQGLSPTNGGGALSVEALQLLYQRASEPESAADALKLLHELQTYQVELDLLYEQLQANEYELNEELAHYRALFERAPVAYLIVAVDGEIIEGNPAAGTLFGLALSELPGTTLASLLAPGQALAMAALLGRKEVPGPAAQSAQQGLVELPDHRMLAVNASFSEAGDSILVILTNVPNTAPGP